MQRHHLALHLRRSAIDNQKHFPEISHIVERNIYMDDLYISTDNVEKTVNIMSSTKASLSLGSFNLTKWNSNSAAFLQQVSRDQLLNTIEASPQIFERSSDYRGMPKQTLM